MHDAMMMGAKKKALMALIKKMRGLEMDGLGDEEDEKMMGNMKEGHDSGDEVVELDEYKPHIESPEDEELGDDDDFMDEKKSFMKKGGKMRSKGKTRAMMLAIESKPKIKHMMKKIG